MIVKGHMVAFHHEGEIKIREIDIPDEEETLADSVEEKLELAFKYGQNDFQSRPVYSLSVGDVIEGWEGFFRVLPVGFAPLDEGEDPQGSVGNTAIHRAYTVYNKKCKKRS